MNSTAVDLNTVGTRWTVVARANAVLALVVLFSFLSRYFLAGKNSYWLDELYSVERYVAQFDTLRAAIGSLATTSIHPPLYQSILYFWVELFGDSETTTRTLSNIFVTTSIIFVHRLVARHFNLHTANATAIAYSLTYGVMYYGLEARSYAQSLALAACSSYAVLVYLEQRESSRVKLLRTPAGVASLLLLCGANIGMMLTHYYNFFFLAAQAIFVGFYILTTGDRRLRIGRLSRAVTAYVFQCVIFLAIWGRVTLHSYRRNTGRFDAEEVTITPLVIMQSVTDRNLSFWRFPTTLALVTVLLGALWVGWSDWQARSELHAKRRFTAVSYLLTMTIGASTLAYLGFYIAQAERLTARYFLFLLPGMLTLLAIVIDYFASVGIKRIAARIPQLPVDLHHQLTALILTGVLLATVLPGSVSAARNSKDDWRTMARDMVAIIESDPESSYIVLEPAFRTTPVYDYYLSQYSDDIRVFGTFRRLEERRGYDYGFEAFSEEIAKSDYIIIPFVHHRTTNFPIALALLQDSYAIEHWQINRDNKGIVIFAIKKSP